MRQALSLFPLLAALVLSAGPLPAATHHVPDSLATIAAALAVSSAGDTVLVEPGTYPETITMVDGVDLLAAIPGDRPVIDGGGTGPVVTVVACGSSTLIRGFTIRNGSTVASGGGASIVASSVAIEDCLFEGNSAVHGGGLSGEGSAFTLSGCEFRDNVASETGGAISVTSVPSPSISGCQLAGNEALVGGAIAVRNGCEPSIDTSVLVANLADQGAAVWWDFLTGGTMAGCTLVAHDALTADGGALWFNSICAPFVSANIVVFGTGGGAVFAVAGNSATLGCNDVFGNAGGDALGGVVDLGTNFSADPLFCDAPGGDYTLAPASPCLPGGPCGLVGALGAGNCGTISAGAQIETLSWSRIKALYRR
ncbi:MAG: right-handed parallel beta-helix repeat-containing protein [bacterium]